MTTAATGSAQPVGYKLVPGGCFPAMIDPDSPIFQRAEVVGHNLWLTPYRQDERWPCGELCNQSKDDKGLPSCATWRFQSRRARSPDASSNK
jgi:primary-amine oxidase